MSPVIRAVLFDMDGVLVDANRSYFATIAQTVDVYLKRVLGCKDAPDGAALQMEQIHALKRAGGFNNEWDATRAFLRAIVAGLDWPQAPDDLAVEDWDSWLSERGHIISVHEAIEKAKIDDFVRGLHSAGGGPKAVEQICGASGRSWIKGSGSVTEENLVERIFQEIYLGPIHFERTYQSPPRFHHEAGFMEQEEAVIPPDCIHWITEVMPTAIATGRPRLEAQLALDLLGYDGIFGATLTLDDAKEEQRRRGDGVRLEKPHPFTLVEAMNRLGVQGDFIFFGDLTDDIAAAKRAALAMKVQCVPIAVVTGGSKQEQAMRAAGAEDVIVDFSQTRAVLEKWIPSLVDELGTDP